MKKIATAVLVGFLSLGFACGGGGSQTGNAQAASATTIAVTLK